MAGRRLAPWAWGGLVVAAGAIDFWGSRYNLNPDGISYIEMARHAVEAAPDGLISGYWSPGYPAALAPVLAIVGHDWVTTVPALHAVNLVLYLLTGWLCLRLFRAVSGAPAAGAVSAAPSLSRHAVSFGAAAYALIAIQCIGLGLVTPDFGVMLCVLATAWCGIQIERSERSWSWAIAFGLVLGAGYWVKGILLPLNALLLFGCFVLPPRADRARAKVLLAATLFGLVCLPLVALVSARVGRVTIGEVGRLNYAWAIDEVTPYTGWVGDSTGQFGIPVHPPRVLQAEPQTLEFATPIHATYPLWFDPAYWYAGVRPRFDAQRQWQVFLDGLHELASLARQQWVLWLGVLALWFASARDPQQRRRRRMPMILGVWSISAALVYALVHVEPRYLAGFLVVGLIAVWSELTRRATRRAMPAVMTVVVAAVLLSLTRHVADTTFGYSAAYRPEYLIDADSLRSLGVAPGDRVAMVGDAFEAYAAFGADTPIAAQVVDSTGFWQLSPQARLALQARLAGIGVKALLANDVQPGMAVEGWRLVIHADSPNLGILLLTPR